MASKYREAVVALRNEHPDWTQREIAAHLGCHIETVRYALSAARRANVATRTARWTSKPDIKKRRAKQNKAWREANPDKVREYDRNRYRRLLDLDAQKKAEELQASILRSIGYREA